MRNALFVAIAVFLFMAGSVFGSTCYDPYLLLPGAAGDLISPCPGGIDFVSARIYGNTLTVVKKMDKTSPLLFLWCLNGKHLTNAQIVVPSQTYKFGDVLVTSVSQSGSPAAETVTFSFSTFETAVPVTLSRIRDITIAGTSQPPAVGIVFMGTGALAWQASARGGLPATIAAAVQLKTAPTIDLSRQATRVTGCTDLRRADGSVLVRYVFDAVVPAQGGSFTPTKFQIQMSPSGTSCTFDTTSGGWNLGNNIAV